MSVVIRSLLQQRVIYAALSWVLRSTAVKPSAVEALGRMVSARVAAVPFRMGKRCAINVAAALAASDSLAVSDQELGAFPWAPCHKLVARSRRRFAQDRVGVRMLRP